jgi:hypothetical protein
MKHDYKDKNWRVNYFDLPFEERKSPQDFKWNEDKFDNYSGAEEKASRLEQSPNAYDVTIALWDGDNCKATSRFSQRGFIVVIEEIE